MQNNLIKWFLHVDWEEMYDWHLVLASFGVRV